MVLKKTIKYVFQFNKISLFRSPGFEPKTNTGSPLCKRPGLFRLGTHSEKQASNAHNRPLPVIVLSSIVSITELEDL